jgi:hypothetical protein
MTATTTIHDLPVEPDRYGTTGRWGFPHRDGVNASHVVTVGSSSTRFGYGYVDPTGSCRRDFGGPIEAGPYAYLFGLASVLLGAEYRRPEPPVEIHVEVGDYVRFPDGQTFVVEAIPFDRHNFRLTAA